MEESIGGYVEEGSLEELAEVIGVEGEPVHDIAAVMELVEEGPGPEGEAVQVTGDDDGVITDKVTGGGNGDKGEGQDHPEVGAEDADISLQDDDDAFGGEEVPSPSISMFQNIPCLACGSNCFIKSESDPVPSEGSLYSGAELLLKFCQFLKIRKVGFWDAEDGARVPICGGCKNQLALLLELERKLKELENDFRNGVREFRSMCEGAEGVFQTSGIYEKDVRYFKVRKQVVRRTGGARPSLPRRKVAELKVPKTEVDPPKRSARGRKSIRTKSLSALSRFSPVVAVSENDRAKADEFQIVKSEVISDAEFDNDNDDGFQLNSPMDVDEEDMVGNDKPSNSKSNNSQLQLSIFEPSIVNSTSKKRKRQQPLLPHHLPPKPKLKRGRKPKSSKKALTANGQRIGRGRPRKNYVTPPEASMESKKTDKARQIVTITDQNILDAFIYGDSEDEEVKGKSVKSAKKARKKKEDADYQVDDKNLEENESEDEDNWDENERTQHDPSTGEFIYLHVTFTPLFDGTDKFKCSECGLQTAKSSLRKHTLKYHTTRFKCKECGQCEGSPAHLRNHIRYKHQEKKKPGNECPICGKPCSSMKNRFLNHITTHYSEQEKAEALARGEKLRMWKDRRNIQCDHCGKKFTSKKELERHSLSKHPKPEEAGMMLMYKELCPDCGKLVDRHYINLHRMRSHNVTLDANLTVGTTLEQEGPIANKRFICTVCDKRFFKSKELVRHKMSVHDRNYPFKCELCPRAFLLQRQLDRHMNTHSNTRPFPCSHCPMAFFTNGNRTRHISIYHAEGANPRRKAYVRGSTSCNAKRFQINPPDTDPPPQSSDVYIIGGSGVPPSSATESSESNSQQNQIKNEKLPQSSGSVQAHVHHSSKPPGNEAELLESIMQFQTAMSSTGGGGGSTAVPATVIQSATGSASFMQEFLFRHQQHHQSN